MKIQWRKDSISINDVGKPGQPHAKKKKVKLDHCLIPFTHKRKMDQKFKCKFMKS